MQGGGLRALAMRLAGVPRFPTTQVRGLSTRTFRPRERKLLEDDPALREFKSTKSKVKAIKTLGDVLVLAVVAGGTYEIYYRVMARKAARAESKKEEGEVEVAQ